MMNIYMHFNKQSKPQFCLFVKWQIPGQWNKTFLIICDT